MPTTAAVVSHDTGRRARNPAGPAVGGAYLLLMPTNSAEWTPAKGRVWPCCLLFAVLAPVVWFMLGALLPERVFWFPIWVGAVIWNGADGRGGISHLFGLLG